MNKLGDRINKLRKERGWSAEQLGFETELNTATILSHENHKSHPRGKNINKYAEAFGITVQELVGGVE